MDLLRRQLELKELPPCCICLTLGLPPKPARFDSYLSMVGKWGYSCLTHQIYFGAGPATQLVYRP